MRFRCCKLVTAARPLQAWVLLALLTACLRAAESEPIDLTELPDPPPEIRRLIDRGPLQWEFGSAGDPAATLGKPHFAAETTYRVRYSYQSRANWKVNPTGTMLTVKVRFARIVWRPTHRIWFLKQPPQDGFWSDQIVRHELDHLRISSDPLHGQRFRKRLREESVFVHPLDAGDVVNSDFVDQLVQQHVDRIFHEYADLIAIRYQELDRITKHGRLPVPGQSPIAEFLIDSTRADE